jgi:hypothetical protein
VAKEQHQLEQDQLEKAQLEQLDLAPKGVAHRLTPKVVWYVWGMAVS